MTPQEAADGSFLALVLWRESRGESTQGKVAVCFSILNRVARPKWWGKTLCEVLFKKWQYSSMTDPNDPQLTTWPDPKSKAWQECLEVAWLVTFGGMSNPVPGADSYYDISMDEAGKPPFWIETARFVAQIGRIKFYDVDHDYEGA